MGRAGYGEIMGRAVKGEVVGREKLWEWLAGEE